MGRGSHAGWCNAELAFFMKQMGGQLAALVTAEGDWSADVMKRGDVDGSGRLDVDEFVALLRGVWQDQSIEQVPPSCSDGQVANRNGRGFGRGRSRGRFATYADFPLHDGSPYSHAHVRREGLGFVHRSRTILCRAVPNPNVTIRNFCIALPHPPKASPQRVSHLTDTPRSNRASLPWACFLGGGFQPYGTRV
jgi:hypothetical protein